MGVVLELRVNQVRELARPPVDLDEVRPLYLAR
jgi:hypothetical protein